MRNINLNITNIDYSIDYSVRAWLVYNLWLFYIVQLHVQYLSSGIFWCYFRISTANTRGVL
jgi:hypothetical protein